MKVARLTLAELLVAVVLVAGGMFITFGAAGAVAARQSDVAEEVGDDDAVIDDANEGDDATDSPNTENWQFILGALQPLVLSVILQSTWSRRLQAVVAFVFSVVATAVGMYLAGDFALGMDYVTGILAVFSSSIVAYYGFWKPTGVAPAIEAKTSPGT